jgi:phosphohistidine phosphatase
MFISNKSIYLKPQRSIRGESSVNLYIMRHGLAEPARGRPDQERCLLAEGEAQILSVATQMVVCAQEMPVDLIIASPYVRTQQSAMIFNKVVKLSRSVLTSTLVVPEGDAGKVANYLSQFGDKNVLLISHMPLVSYLIGYLTTGDTQSFGGLDTAQLVYLQGDYSASGSMREVKTLFPV